MLFSFVITTKNFGPAFEASFKSIIAQKLKNFEVILIVDRSLAENVKNNAGKEIFWNHDNVKLILNNTAQGMAVSFNNAICLAEGKYMKFINEGDLLDEEFTTIITQELEKFSDETLDVVEYTAHLSGTVDTQTITYLEKNKVYKLGEELKPYAYINQILFNKLFSTKLIQQYGFKFRKFVRFDTLFVYKALIQAKTYIHLETSKLVEAILIEKVDYSAFDEVNQWIHIFNYYRRMGKFKLYKDELDYAYFKSTIHIWLWTVRSYNNKVLMKKAIDYISKKFNNRVEEFVATNKIFETSEDKKFIEICKNFNKYMKDIQKKS